MKVALIVPPITFEERYNKAIAYVAGSLPPLGLISIGTVLKNAGNEVIVLDGSVMSFSEILIRIKQFEPDIVGLTAMTMMWPKVKLLSRKLKEIWPSINIIVGGVHASLIKEKVLLDVPYIDAVAWGEGEFSMLEYVENFGKFDSIKKIDGIAFRCKDGDIAMGSERNPIEDINNLPIPNRNLVPITQYIPAFEQYRSLPITNIITTRGCPFKCIFCLPGILGKGVRYRSVDKTIEEIEYLINEFGVRDIAIWDDIFTLNKKRVYNICEYIIKKKLHFIWSANTRADCTDPELLTIMARANCWKLHYGVESLVQKNLDTLKKGETVEQIFQAVQWTKKSGIEVEASFIFGIPGETFEEGLKTIELAKKLDPDYAKFYPLSPYGELFAEIKKYGIVITDKEENFGGQKVTFVPFSMSKKELYRLYYMAYRQFYLRPKVLHRRLKKVGKPLEFRKSLRGLLALGTLFGEELKNKLKYSSSNNQY